jgi:hypothetical protein
MMNCDELDMLIGEKKGLKERIEGRKQSWLLGRTEESYYWRVYARR